MTEHEGLSAEEFLEELVELQQNRKKLHEIVDKLESLIQDIEAAFPKKIDYRSKFILAERVDTLTRLFDTILRYRSEISKQVKEEINIRKNIEKGDVDYSDLIQAISTLSPVQIKKMLNQDQNESESFDIIDPN